MILPPLVFPAESHEQNLLQRQNFTFHDQNLILMSNIAADQGPYSQYFIFFVTYQLAR